MASLVCVYAVGLTEYALRRSEALGTSPFEAVVETVRELPDVERGVLVTDLEPDRFVDSWPNEFGPLVRRNYDSVGEVLETLREKSEGSDYLYLVRGDTPLLDPELSRRMFERHRTYYASYTFADGYPRGLAPEILRTDVLPQLAELAGRHSVGLGRSMIFDIVSKDINAFDLETEVSPTDLRLHRVLLAADTRRNLRLLERVVEHGGADAESVMRVVEERQEILRTLPAYMQVQVTEGCPQSCSYCPYPRAAEAGQTVSGRRADVRELDGRMSLEQWRRLMEDAHRLCDDLVVGIGLWGDPSLHEDIAEMAEASLAYPRFSLVIETSGVGWSAEVLKRMSSLDTNRIDWIVSLDAAERDTYTALRGEQWDEALAAIDMLRELFSDERVHVQAVRMTDNEEELERFYRRWKAEGIPLIVQKYDHFCGYLPDKKVTDLSPLTRFPCVHLKRDLTVLLDGTVRMCREDLRGEYEIGNVLTEGIEKVWERVDSYYQSHVAGNLPALCERCDEYYTYNF